MLNILLKKRNYLVIYSLLTLFLLCGCGQTGPLYLPPAHTTQQVSH